MRWISALLKILMIAKLFKTSMKHIIFDDYNTLLPGIVHNIIFLTNDIKADTG